jgi:hypothetical protein
LRNIGRWAGSSNKQSLVVRAFTSMGMKLEGSIGAAMLCIDDASDELLDADSLILKAADL